MSILSAFFVWQVLCELHNLSPKRYVVSAHGWIESVYLSISKVGNESKDYYSLIQYAILTRNRIDIKSSLNHNG